MAVTIRTSEAPDTEKAQAQVRNVQEEARQAEEKRKSLELFLKQIQEAAAKRKEEMDKGASIENEINEVARG